MQVTITSEGIFVRCETNGWARHVHVATVSDPTDSRKQLQKFTTRAHELYIPMNELFHANTVEISVFTVSPLWRDLTTIVTVDLKQRKSTITYTIQCMYI